MLRVGGRDAPATLLSATWRDASSAHQPPRSLVPSAMRLHLSIRADLCRNCRRRSLAGPEQAAAVKILGVSQPGVSDLLQVSSTYSAEFTECAMEGWKNRHLEPAAVARYAALIRSTNTRTRAIPASASQTGRSRSRARRANGSTQCGGTSSGGGQSCVRRAQKTDSQAARRPA